MSIKFFWLKDLPDLLLSKYQAFAQGDTQGLLELQKTFLRQWSAICGLYDLTLHLFIVYKADGLMGKRLRIGISLRGNQKAIDEMVPLLFSSSLMNFFTFYENADEDSRILAMCFQNAATLTKNTRQLPPRQGGLPYWFVPEWEMNEEARLVDLEKIMESTQVDCAYRVDVYPQNMVQSTRDAFKNIMDSIRKLIGFGDDGRVVLSDTYRSKPRDQNAEDALRQFEDWIESLETSPHMMGNIFAFADTEIRAKLLLHTAGSEALEEGEYSVFAVKDMSSPFSIVSGIDSESTGARSYIPEADFPEKLSFWPCAFLYDELSAFFRLPVLYEGEVIQLPKETACEVESDGLLLGHDVFGHPVHFPVEKINKHAFICGVPGSGKTNTMLHLTSTLWKQYRIPFLVFEPAKKEYRTLLNDPLMKDVVLFSPSAGSDFPISINPFEFPEGLKLSEHITNLLEVFSGSFELMGPAWRYLNDSIQQAYYDLGWTEDSVNTGEQAYPTLSQVISLLRVKIEESSYDGDIKGNLRSFLETRIGRLMVRESNEMFNVSQSTLRPERWLKIPVIVELESLESGVCNFFILLLCTLIRETLRVNPSVRMEHNLRHVIFIEEAHNLIAPDTEQANSETVDPKISATAYITKMLAEVRALKEGIVIADQLPSKIASEVLKNSGLKIVHRMTAQDDRVMVGSTMSATEVQLEHLVTYDRGDALVFYEGLQLPFRMVIQEWEKGKVCKDAPFDKELAEILRSDPDYQDMLLDTIDELFNKLVRENLLPYEEEMNINKKQLSVLGHAISSLYTMETSAHFEKTIQSAGELLKEIYSRFRVIRRYIDTYELKARAYEIRFAPYRPLFKVHIEGLASMRLRYNGMIQDIDSQKKHLDLIMSEGADS